MEINSPIVHLLCGHEEGGITTVLFSLIREKKAFQQLTVIILKKTPLTDKIYKEGVRVSDISARTILSPLLLLRILLVIRKEKIRVIHTHSIIPHIYGFLIKSLTRNVSLLVHVHADIYRELMSNISSTVKKKIYYFGTLIALKASDTIVANSEAVRRNLLEKGVKAEKVVVVYNGINIEDIRKKAVQSQPDADFYNRLKDKKVIGTIGRLTPIKDHKVLISAASSILQKNPDVIFVIVGDGVERGNLENMVSELGISGNVIFTGWLDPPYSILSLMDIFVLTSAWEGLGVVILEAMALQKPVIATYVGGIPEIIEHEATGLLVPPGDPDVLSAAILRLLYDTTLREVIGERGKSVAETKFSSTSMVNAIEGVYSSLG